MSTVHELIKRHEGYRQFAYRCPAGKLTIGYGTMIEKGGPGISKEVAAMALADEVAKVVAALMKSLPWFQSLDEVRQAVLIDMGYNLGITGLLSFKNTLAHVEAGRYTAAAENMKKSRWFTQVGSRATRLCWMMENGQWPKDMAQ